MKWSEKAWEAVVPIYNKTLKLPFIQELINGTLDREKFVFYIQQDALYLFDYGKVLTGIASRLNDPDQIAAFIYFANDTMVVEKALHESFMKGVPSVKEPSPSCLLYTSYLLSRLSVAPVEVAAAAVLPCFWIYKEVGDYILKYQTRESNPYQQWIDTYGGEEYAGAVEKAIRICDELADRCTPERREEMIRAFITCSKLEYLFWESAYKLEQWNI
jgi:Putative transcription activator